MINVTDFTKEQRQALLDLLVLAMYMDGSLASAETAHVQELLVAMDLDTDYDRNREFDASVNRVRQHSESIDGARACAGKLAQSFTSREQQKIVMDVLNDLTTSDGKISSRENSFLSVVNDVFKI
ncbi:MAG: hypothetical protein JWQ71_1416 [Pedosphaera sp.]|nr:hypothetical protein [Pedosphaera sp.]